MNYLKQSTAATLTFGPFVDSTDGFTAETALSVTQSTIRLSKAGGAFAQKGDTSTATHMENGYYSVALNTTDTATLGRLVMAANITGALPVWAEFTVVLANVFDSLVAGTEFLETTDLKQDFSISGTALTAKMRDGATTQFTRTITTNAAADPIVGLD